MKAASLFERANTAVFIGAVSDASELVVLVRNIEASLDSPEAWREFAITSVDLDDDEPSLDLSYGRPDEGPGLVLGDLRTILRKLAPKCSGYDVFTSEFRQMSQDEGMMVDTPVIGIRWDADRAVFGVAQWYEGFLSEFS